MANFQLVSQFSEAEQAENKRFVEASAAEIEELSKKSFKKNTQYATRNAVSIYKKFCVQLGIQSDLKIMVWYIPQISTPISFERTHLQ